MEQYVHLLIARSDDFVPTAHQIGAFCKAIVEEQVVPAVEEISLSTPSDRARTGVNPFTGEPVSFPVRNRQPVKDFIEFESMADELLDYELRIDGAGRPKIPPIPLDFRDPYAISVSCNVNSVPKSTSNICNDALEVPDLVSFAQPCPEPMPFGYFTEPINNGIIKIADAGRARFWIEFEFGKWLFPIIHDGDLAILNPRIVQWAERDFGTSFAQGCRNL